MNTSVRRHRGPFFTCVCCSFLMGDPNSEFIEHINLEILLLALTHFMPLVSLTGPESIGKPLVF